MIEMKILVILNHTPTDEQIAELQSMGYEDIEIVKHPSIDPYADSVEVFELFRDTIRDKNFNALWVQGDYRFFAQALLYCLANGKRLLVATTERISKEERHSDGSIEIRRVFRHAKFVPII